MYKTCVHTPNACETIIISSHNTITRKPYCFCHKFSFTITTKPYCFCQESNKLVFLFGIFQSLAFLWKCPDFQNCKRNAIVWTDWASLIIITPISLIPTLIGIVKIPQTQDGFFQLIYEPSLTNWVTLRICQASASKRLWLYLIYLVQTP